MDFDFDIENQFPAKNAAGYSDYTGLVSTLKELKKFTVYCGRWN